jgi:NADH dehydrogenase
MPIPGNPPLVTVFGGGGFIGRYVCEALIKAGVRLRIAERHPRNAFFLQPLGGLGQIATTQADLSRPHTIDQAVDGANAVINLVGVFKGDLHAIHAEGAGHAAAAARDAGASSFVQISAIGADPDSASLYGRTKGLGERAVRDAFPDATIIRPSVVFGAEDDFTNRFASMARLPVAPVIAPNTRFQPVFVRDLGQAIAMAALEPQRFGGHAYDIAGPEVLTMRALNQKIAAMAGHSPHFADVPDVVASAIAKLGFLPGAPLSSDQWAMLQSDNIAADDASGLEAFGIVPTPLAAVAPDWLGRFVKGGRFAPRATA